MCAMNASLNRYRIYTLCMIMTLRKTHTVPCSIYPHTEAYLQVHELFYSEQFQAHLTHNDYRRAQRNPDNTPGNLLLVFLSHLFVVHST